MASPRLSVAVFRESVSNKFKRAALESFAASAPKQNVRCTLASGMRYVNCDIAVLWGLPKEEAEVGERFNAVHLLRNEVFARHAGPIVTLEAPLLGRQVTAKRKRSKLMKRLFPAHAPWTQALLPPSSYMDQIYEEYRIGIGGGFPDQGGFALAPYCVGRWAEVSARLDLPQPQPYRDESGGGHVLVIGQVPGDASLRGLDINLWLLDTCRSIRAITDRPIVLRPHPLAYGETAAAVAGALAEIGVTLDVPAKPLSVTLRSAWVTVTHSSGAAIDSVLAGVPAIALSPASFAWDVTDHDLTAVVSPRLYERESWLDKLGAAQWSQEELAQGVLWQPLLEACHAFLLQSVALD